MTSTLMDWCSLKARGIVGSRPTLHRYLHRPVDQNPFPRPLRHTHTGRRYWRSADVEAWQAREAERKAQGVAPEHLAPDTDAANWAPGKQRKNSARHRA
jgi:predicted DNA-binding transcriptional regulator AlpA